MKILQSKKLRSNFKIYVGALHFEFTNHQAKDRACEHLREHGDTKMADLYVVLRLWADGDTLCNSIRTSYKYISSQCLEWNEWVEFQIGYDELPKDTILTADLYNPCKNKCFSGDGPHNEIDDLIGDDTVLNEYHVAGTSIRVWDEQGLFRVGNYHLVMWMQRMSDPSLSSRTPGLFQGEFRRSDQFLPDSSSWSRLLSPVLQF